jgi:dGTP triphosphohydrolase
MDRSYYKKLVTLFESTKLADQEINQAQQTIADTGSDVIDGSMDQQDFISQGDTQPAELTPEEEAMVPETDMGYLTPDSPDVASNEIVSDVSDNMKMLKLCDLFYDLQNYEESFIDSLKNIDFNLLEEDECKKLRDYSKRLNRQKEKLVDYINLRIKSDKYEKAVYVYVLLRTEFLASVKKFRELLKLNEK